MTETATKVQQHADMNAALDAYLPTDGDYVVAEITGEFVKHLRATKPALLSRWLTANAELFLSEHIRHRQRSRVATAARRRPASAFAEAASAYTLARQEADAGLAEGELGGDGKPLRLFAQRLVVNDAGKTRPIGEMTRDDLLFVADNRDKRATTLLLECEFYRALAKQTKPGQTLAQAMSEADVLRLRESIIALAG